MLIKALSEYLYYIFYKGKNCNNYSLFNKITLIREGVLTDLKRKYKTIRDPSSFSPGSDYYIFLSRL
jgi:hypothetical protein